MSDPMKYYIQKGEEFTESELPALKLLHESLHYDYMQPSDVNRLREKDSEIILYKRLEGQLSRLNPWMKDHDETINSVIEKIREENYPCSRNHQDVNEIIHAMYTEQSMNNLKPLEIRADIGDGEETQTVHLFDFENPENNDFLVTNQLSFKKFHGSIKPDITIFVNGFPLVIIECKSPNIADPIGNAIEDNLKKYQNSNNGADRLFFYNLFLVAACGDYAKHGCIDSNSNLYSRWSDTYPYNDDEVDKLSKRKPREQERLIIGMLNKKTLIDILENYVIFDNANKEKIKKLARHQQFRAVSKAIKQLEITVNSSSNLGGTIWHSQGSGKSLTMFWLAKQVRKNKKWGNLPILVVTDRTSLDNQIHINFQSAGWNKPIRVSTAKRLINELKRPEKKVVMTTLQKLGLKDNPDVLTKDQIIVITDESHRGQFGPTATKMRKALPNGIFFAFTATPIDKPNRHVFKTFGDEIDNYSWAESREDGATVGIEYRPKWVSIDIDDAKLLSEEFEKEFAGLSKEQKNMLKKDHIKMKNLRLATERINGIAKKIICDFNARVGIEGFKAMIVASNREAAVRYKKALDAIPKAPESIIIMTSKRGETGIEGDNWDEYYLPSYQRERKSKKFTKSDNKYKILIVSDMLLTGYDAPIIQTMYLDHKLREHTLLQAIARVNRKYKAKQFGTIIDYVNVANELEEAKNMFAKKQSRDLTFDKNQLITDLKDKWSIVMNDVKGIDPTDRDSVLERFASIDNLDMFYTDYRMFEKALDAVMPDKSAEKFLDDFARLSVTISHIRNYLAIDKFSTKPYGNKIQQMLDKYVSSGKIKGLGNIDLDDKQFGEKIKKMKERAGNAAIAGRIGSIIKINKPSNPTFYASIEERLSELLRSERERQLDAKILFARLGILLEEIRSEEERRKDLGLRNGYELAVFDELQAIIEDKEMCIESSRSIYDKILSFTEYVDWPNNIKATKCIEKNIYEVLKNHFPENKITSLSEKIMELAKRHLYER